LALAALATPLIAEENIVNNPGLCDANKSLPTCPNLGLQSIESHALSCYWLQELDYRPDLKTRVDAKCDGHEGPFTLQIDISVNDQWRVAAIGYNDSTYMPE
jgi:hypothetical protein